MDKAQLVEIANTEMPFGKYKGRRLIDVPEEYLLWFARKDQFPAGHLGELMALTLLIKTEGLSDLVQHRADHQLDLVEDHQRQHHDAEDGGREENIGHRNAVGQALFRTAEDDGNLIGFVKAAAAGDKDVDRDDDGQQHQADHHDKQQRSQTDFMPDAIHHRLAKGGVNHQQNRGLVGLTNPLLMLRHPVANPRPR